MKGKCLCGAVTLEIPEVRSVGVCHCNMCRRWGGGPFFAVDFAGPIGIEGAEHVTRYASSDWAERAFCGNCGTHLFYALKSPEHYAVPAGLFDETALEMTGQIFIEEKPAYYDLANDTPKQTGEEVFAEFDPRG